MYLNFRAVRVDDSVAHCYVAFEYAPVFTYSETEPTTEPIDYDNVSPQRRPGESELACLVERHGFVILHGEQLGGL